MAVGNEGIGNDVVVANLFQPMMQTLARNQQLKIAEQQENRKNALKLADEAQKDISKISRNGLRQADLEDFDKGYKDVKELAYLMYNTQDPSTARAIRMQLNSKIGELEGLATQSRKIGEAEIKAFSDISSLVGKGHPDRYKLALQSNLTKKVGEVDPLFADKTPFMLTYDVNKVDSALKNLGDGLKRSRTDVITDRGVVDTFSTTGGKRVDVIGSSKMVKDESILKGVSDLYWKDNNFRNYVDEYMAETGLQDVNQAFAQIGEQYKSQYFTDYSESQTNAEKAKGTSIVVNNYPEPARVNEGRHTVNLGVVNTNEALTFNNDFDVQGTKMFDAQTGQPIKAGRNRVAVSGTSLVPMPVDASGNVVPQGSPKAVGTRMFVLGTAQDPTQRVNIKDQSGLLNKSILVPYEQQQFIQMSKRVEEGVIGGAQASGARKSQNNSVTSQGSYKANTSASSR